MDTIQLLSALIRVAVCDAAPSKELQAACTPEALAQVYSLAHRHDLAHLAGQGAGRLQLPDSPALQACKKAAMQALFRQTRQDFAYENICKLLEQSKIPFIPLKGSVLRNYYPEAWMRTSCDMDILVEQTALAQAAQLLQDSGWVLQDKTSHDWSFDSPEGIHLELHYSAIEDSISESGKKIVDTIWARSTRKAGTQYHRELPDDLFYFYHMAHMAKHLVHGGCGIRTFLDIWILQHRMEFDAAARETLLAQGELTAFAKAAETLAEIWFSGRPMDDDSRRLQDFVLSGGTYGSLQNRVRLQQGQKGGRLKYALSRIFLPYDIMKGYFPVLQKHRWLTPVYHLVRWFRLLFCSGMKRSVQELRTTAEVSDQESADAQALIAYLKL